jgi:hypothetical protein
VQVRTSGVRLLFDIITRHGAALSGEEGRVWDMAFPLLMEVAKNAHLSDEAHRLAAGPLGTKSRLVWPPWPPSRVCVLGEHLAVLAEHRLLLR